MPRLVFVCLLILLTMSSSRTSAAKEGPLKSIPELEALQNYVGRWDVTVRSGSKQILQGNVTAEWILDGRYLQQTASLHSKEDPGVKFTTLMTFDPAKKIYRSWTYLSTGSRSESVGTWDARTRTMTWTSGKDESGNSSTTKADFSSRDVEKVKIVVINPVGSVVSEISAVSNLRK